MTSVIDARRVHFGYGSRPVLRGVDLTVRAGEIVGLVGRNGSGKSTLLRLLAGTLTPSSGEVIVDGQDARSLSRKQYARLVAVMSQHPPPATDLTVAQFVAQGRFAHRSGLELFSERPDAQCLEAMRAAGVQDWQDATLGSLSGGERQRVRVALALAQDAPLMLLDEPTTFLDIGHQLDLMELVGALRTQREAAGRSLSVVMVLHDLNQAARHCDRLVVLNNGLIVADGHPGEVLTTELVAHSFGVAAQICTDPYSGRPFVHFGASLPDQDSHEKAAGSDDASPFGHRAVPTSNAD